MLKFYSRVFGQILALGHSHNHHKAEGLQMVIDIVL